jgi:hypothetical protein
MSPFRQNQRVKFKIDENVAWKETCGVGSYVKKKKHAALEGAPVSARYVKIWQINKDDRQFYN